MAAIIELDELSKHFGPVIGVDGVNLAVEDGEFLTLLGPSGCGKSTLLRMIGGFEQPTAGAIRIAGTDVTDVPPQQRDVNMMFQDYALFPHMPVGKNITYGLERKGIRGAAARDRAQSALDLVGLTGLFDRYPHQLSGGQRQRVALARAVVREPKVILLDEPLSALDANLREQMQVELKHMHDKLGITFIMVTHDQTEALVMSDRVVVMQNGRIAQDGSPEDLYERPSTPYVANFIGTTNFLPVDAVMQNENGIQLQSGGNALVAAGTPPAAAHSIRQLGIRPEKARFLNGDAEHLDNVVNGTVVETIYLGLALRTVVRLQSGHEFLVDELLPKGMLHSTHARPGDDVQIGIEADNILLFAAEA